MTLSQSLLPEFDREMAQTRTCLDRVPADKLEWRPHPKSMSFAQLAGFLALLPSWTTVTLAQDTLDIEPPGAPPPPGPPGSVKEMLETFDVNHAAGRGALQAATDERLLAPWTLLKGGQKVLTLPRVAILRSFVLNHLIHHRGQLTVYLRLCGVPVPALYGPSGDEGGWK